MDFRDRCSAVACDVRLGAGGDRRDHDGEFGDLAGRAFRQGRRHRRTRQQGHLCSHRDRAKRRFRRDHAAEEDRDDGSEEGRYGGVLLPVSSEHEGDANHRAVKFFFSPCGRRCLRGAKADEGSPQNVRPVPLTRLVSSMRATLSHKGRGKVSALRGTVSIFKQPLLVVSARSTCDEAIQFFLVALDCFASLAMTTRHNFSFSRRTAPEPYQFVRSLRKQEGAGKTGCALHPRSHVQCASTKNAHEHTGSAEAVRPSLRNGLTTYTCSPW